MSQSAVSFLSNQFSPMQTPADISSVCEGSVASGFRD